MLWCGLELGTRSRFRDETWGLKMGVGELGFWGRMSVGCEVVYGHHVAEVGSLRVRFPSALVRTGLSGRSCT